VRVVLDTNTLVSAILSPLGPPRRLLDDARAQVFELCSSPVLMAELLDVMSREKFARRLAAAELTPLGIVGEIRRLATMATPTEVPRIVAGDADDDHVLACAVTAAADLIVSGDRHLLGLGSHYHGIPIVTPAQAVATIAQAIG
jgi:putative PIN family toxin of toxin-antitoxin system